MGFRLRENLPLVGGYAAGFFAVFASGLRHYLCDQGFFIDMSGRYLGEVVHGNRLTSNRGKPAQIDEFWCVWQPRKRGKLRQPQESPETLEQLAVMTMFRRTGCGDRGLDGVERITI